MKLITYNINGIRAAMKKGFTEWVAQNQADVVCLQEVKALQEQVDLQAFEQMGYHIYWAPAQKKGYSGVAILSKPKPEHIKVGCGIDAYDNEGRTLMAHYGQLTVVSVYMPSGSSGDERQAFKMQYLDDFYGYVQALKKEYPNLVISGDYNICHKPIDIHNPVANKKTSGFLPEEREWLDKFVNSGFTDTFRHFNQDPHHYTWWSYRARAREKNLGWRIDYHMATQALNSRLKGAQILPEAQHSDHCPVLLEID